MGAKRNVAATRSSQAEEVVDPDSEQVLERVCAIDVAKMFGMVCTRLPQRGPGDRRVSKTWEVSATTNAIMKLAGQLVDLKIEKVTLESTSDYWRIWFYLLQAQGLDVQLVNARDVKNVPGRPKTDKQDSVWLAKLTEKGLLRASFVPPPEIRNLRDYTRLRIDLTREQTRHWQRLEKLLEDALIKVSSVSSTITTMSVRDMIEALIVGERDPRVLAKMARGRMKVKYLALVEALTGKFDEHHAELAQMLLDQIDGLQAQIDQLTARITDLIAAMQAAQAPVWQPPPDDGNGDNVARPPLPAVQRLAEIPGLSIVSAQIILAEIGLDMSIFPTPEHLASWAKLTPVTAQSGSKKRSGKTGKGNPYLKGALGIAASSLAKTDTHLAARHHRMVKRRGKLKALVATARNLLIIVWHLLSDPTQRFKDLGSDYHNNRLDVGRRIRNHKHQLEALGYDVTITPRTAAAA